MQQRNTDGCLIHSPTCLAPITISHHSLWLCPSHPFPSQKCISPGWRIPPFKSGQCYCYQTVTKQTCPKSGTFPLCAALPCRNRRAMKCVSPYTICNLCIFWRNSSHTLHPAFLKQWLVGRTIQTILYLQKMGSLQVFPSTSCLICEDQSVLIKKCEVSKKNA